MERPCPDPNPLSNTAVTVTTSYSALARRCGWNTGGSSIQRVREGLQRLAETTLWVVVARLKGSTRLLAWELGDDKQVRLAVNWRLAMALQGEGQYARVSLTERLKLGDEIAKALHAWLSCQMNSLSVWRSGLDKLQRHVWGDIVAGVNGRVRRFKLRRALADIGELPGWSISIKGDMATFARDLQAKPRKGGLVVTETTRRIAPKSSSSPKRRETAETRIHAALPVVSAADLFSKNDGVA